MLKVLLDSEDLSPSPLPKLFCPWNLLKKTQPHSPLHYAELQKWVEASPFSHSENSRIFTPKVNDAKTIEILTPFFPSLFIPGHYCRQADTLKAAKESSRWILVERGTFLSPQDMLFALDRLDPQKTILVDSGSHFGADDVVFDPRALSVYHSRFSLPVYLNLGGLQPGYPDPNLASAPPPLSSHYAGWLRQDFTPCFSKLLLPLGISGVIVTSPHQWHTVRQNALLDPRESAIPHPWQKEATPC